MYCPHCAAETSPGLKYCTRCGGGLGAQDSAAPEFPILLTVAFLAVILIIMTIGMAVPFVALSELAGKGFSARDLKALMVLSPLVAFGICGLLVWLLLRLININRGSGAASGTKQPPISQYIPGAIPAPPHSVASVTEHTTRTFENPEPAHAKREPERRVTR